jgi:Uma2 family endonuclease
MSEQDHITNRLSVSDYIRQYKKEKPLEIVNYEPRLQTPMVAGRGIVAQNVYNAFVSYQDDLNRNPGETFFRLPYLVLDKVGLVKEARLPDVCFIRSERWNKYIADKPEWQNNPLLITPDVVVKVLSPDDTENGIEEWIKLCIQDGVQSAWYVDWKRKQVDIYSVKEHLTLGQEPNDFITGIEVMLGFMWSVDALIHGV